ncbi:hypothetical protein C5167_000940 [Papaver somniferum]|uniref:phosphopyruvate hydratase n=1 Tax=Papaver somniferum TaxID=3469 RepID=A0A4Y7KXV0_PAPSO|nr:hypothetical protein C5167_000940 [Papaver somniferum]
MVTIRTILEKGVCRAVTNTNEKVAEALVSTNPTLPSQIDQAMIDLEKTENEAIIIGKYGRNGCNVDEAGGFALNMPSFTKGSNLVKEPIDRGDYSDRIKIAMDVAATDFCVGCWSLGDDLLMSNLKRTEKAIDEITCNMLVLKVNQIGTVTEIIEAVKLAKNANWGVVTSQRCGETEYSFIVEADLSVVLPTSQIT